MYDLVKRNHLCKLQSSGVLPKYFSSEWSSAQFHLAEETYHIAAFDAQDTVMIVGMDGRYCSYLIL